MVKKIPSFMQFLHIYGVLELGSFLWKDTGISFLINCIFFKVDFTHFYAA